ncbi:MAG: Zn-ribbon domain-containing OB-fold protein [Chloroflexi bacterium]|nr:Zn-ribbon domain-containing OB-fold protein [Chloroflexota bacterium]
MSVLGKVDTNKDARAWCGEIPLQSRYTYGLAGENFFREILENARFMGTRCSKCHFTYVPPTIYCERCLSKLEEWVEVSTEGVVQSFTVLLVAPDGSPLDEPEVLALVQLDGADSMLVHRLGKVDWDELAIGMRVKAVFKPPRKREGSISDIVHFVPVS